MNSVEGKRLFWCSHLTLEAYLASFCQRKKKFSGNQSNIEEDFLWNRETLEGQENRRERGECSSDKQEPQ